MSRPGECRISHWEPISLMYQGVPGGYPISMGGVRNRKLIASIAKAARSPIFMGDFMFILSVFPGLGLRAQSLSNN